MNLGIPLSCLSALLMNLLIIRNTAAINSQTMQYAVINPEYMTITRK